MPLHEVLRRLAKGGASNLEVLDLSHNALGGTIASDIAMFPKLKKLDLSQMGLDGKICRTHHTYTHALHVLLDIFTCVAGELPKQLPVSLKVLHLGRNAANGNTFTGGIPSEWGLLTNLKELMMVACSLDGEICMFQHTCVVVC